MATTRRMFGQVVMAMTAALVLAGSMVGITHASEQTYNYGSKAKFEFYCKVVGGRFVVDQYGDLKCYYTNGDWENCDANGADCYYIPKPRTEQPDPPLQHEGDLGLAPEDSPSGPSAGPDDDRSPDAQASESPRKKAKNAAESPKKNAKNKGGKRR